MVEGMTLRDFFAAQAMREFIRVAAQARQETPHSLVAQVAYVVADEMMKARGGQ